MTGMGAGGAPCAASSRMTKNRKARLDFLIVSAAAPPLTT